MPRRCILVAVAATIAACSDPDPDPLRLHLQLDRAMVSASDSVRISLQLINESSSVVRTPAADSYGFCTHAFKVFDQINREVGIPTGFCALALVANPLVDLPPGSSLSITEYWHPARSTLDGHAIPPGTYRIIGRVFGESEDVRSGPATVIVVP